MSGTIFSCAASETVWVIGETICVSYRSFRKRHIVAFRRGAGTGVYVEIHEDSEHRRNARSRAQQTFSQALRAPVLARVSPAHRHRTRKWWSSTVVLMVISPGPLADQSVWVFPSRVTSQLVPASWVTRKVVGDLAAAAAEPRQMPTESRPRLRSQNAWRTVTVG